MSDLGSGSVDANVRITATDESAGVWSNVARAAQDASTAAQAAMQGGLNQSLDQTQRRIVDLHSATEQHVGRGMTDNFNRAKGAADALIAGLTGGIVGASAVGLAERLGHQITDGIRDVGRLEDAMVRIREITGASAEQLDHWGKMFDELRRTTGQSVEEMAASFQRLAAGPPEVASNLDQLFPAIARAAFATGSTLDGMVGAVSAAVSRLQVPAEQVPRLLDRWAIALRGIPAEEFTRFLVRTQDEMAAFGFTGEQNALGVAAAFRRLSEGMGGGLYGARRAAQEFQTIFSENTIIGDRTVREFAQRVRAQGGDIIDLMGMIDGYVTNTLHVFEDGSTSMQEASRRMQQYFQSPESRAFVTALHEQMQAIRATRDETGNATGTINRRVTDLNNTAGGALRQLSGDWESLREQMARFLLGIGLDRGMREFSDSLNAVSTGIERFHEKAEELKRFIETGKMDWSNFFGAERVHSIIDVLRGEAQHLDEVQKKLDESIHKAEESARARGVTNEPQTWGDMWQNFRRNFFHTVPGHEGVGMGLRLPGGGVNPAQAGERPGERPGEAPPQIPGGPIRFLDEGQRQRRATEENTTALHRLNSILDREEGGGGGPTRRGRWDLAGPAEGAGGGGAAGGGRGGGRAPSPGGGGRGGGGGGGGGGATTGPAPRVEPGPGVGHTASRADRIAFAREYATSRGLNPDAVVATMAGEGLNRYEGDFTGGRPTSFGDFQLHVGGGSMGDQAVRAGINIRDPNTWREQTKFAIDQMAANRHRGAAWYGSQWHGAPAWATRAFNQPGDARPTVQPAAATHEESRRAGARGGLPPDQRYNSSGQPISAHPEGETPEQRENVQRSMEAIRTRRGEWGRPAESHLIEPGPQRRQAGFISEHAGENVREANKWIWDQLGYPGAAHWAIDAAARAMEPTEANAGEAEAVEHGRKHGSLHAPTQQEVEQYEEKFKPRGPNSYDYQRDRPPEAHKPAIDPFEFEHALSRARRDMERPIKLNLDRESMTGGRRRVHRQSARWFNEDSLMSARYASQADIGFQ